MNEKWLPIEGYENYYVSDMGRVYSKGKDALLSTRPRKDGYVNIALWNNNGRKVFTLHRLVAMHHVPNPENKSEVDHIVPICKGGSHEASNLQWVSRRENSDRLNTMIREDISAKPREAIPTERTIGRSVKQYNLDGVLVATYGSINQAGRAMGVKTGNNIGRAIRDRNGFAYGYYWEYMD